MDKQIVLDEMEKDFTQTFVALAYEEVCRDVFASLCRSGEVEFTLSRIGSYWLNDREGDTEIDVMAVDHQHKLLFAGECKYHAKPVDAQVYFDLREKVERSVEVAKAFPGYEVICGVFSKSGFTQRLLNLAVENPALLLVNEDKVV